MINNPNSIGGYFELELPQGSEFHSAAIALNTGRTCLEYILRVRSYRRIYLPFYSCDVLLEPFEKLDVDYTFYHINECLELDEEIQLQDGEALLCINYFGLKQDHIETLAAKYGQQLIVDNTQAFYAHPIEGIDTFYSCRKFFGVADGAYLYCDKPLDQELEQDQSWARMTHLLKRIDVSTEAAYEDFCGHEEQLKGNPIKSMSSLTRRIMASIDYQRVSQRRRENYRLLDNALKDKNRISLPLTETAVPMVYPFLIDDVTLRSRLISSKIYIAQYWPNIKERVLQDSIEYFLSSNLLSLPIDQRYTSEVENRIIKLIINL